MIAALPEGPPVYAIDMEWLCEAKQEFTVEQIATFYIDIIRQVQSSGPYYFCGYSFGGLVAYETATQFINRGDNVSLVALLDAPNPALLSNLSETDSAKFRRTYLVDRLRKYAFDLVRGDLKAFTDRGSAFVISRAGRFLMPWIKLGFRILNRPLPVLFRSNDPGFRMAWRSFVPKSYPNSLVCFRVEERGPEHDLDPTMGWGASARGGVQVHVVPGGHVDMMRMPSVGTIADNLAIYLAKDYAQPEELAPAFKSSLCDPQCSSIKRS